MCCPEATSSPAPCPAGSGMLMVCSLHVGWTSKYPGQSGHLPAAWPPCSVLPGTTDPLGLIHSSLWPQLWLPRGPADLVTPHWGDAANSQHPDAPQGVIWEVLESPSCTAYGAKGLCLLKHNTTVLPPRRDCPVQKPARIQK